MREINETRSQQQIIADTKPLLSFDAESDYLPWREQIKEKLFETLGLNVIAENACPLEIEIEEDVEMEDHRRIRFVFESEHHVFVPCYLLIPNTGKEKYPVAITLQGHSSGFHNSVGIKKFLPRDENYQPRGCFGLQAVREGYISLSIEQRGLGERTCQFPKFSCGFHAQSAMMMGRSLVGERVWDIMRAIDLLSRFPQCDTGKILITGNSGGGTASYYAACCDERIGLSVPSCAFCSYQTSLFHVLHCGCNFIPGAYRYYEMEDLACLIAPRRLAVVAGEKDEIFPIEGVRRSFATAKAIYEKAGAADNCSLTVTPREHRWCEEIVWGVVREEAAKLGWI
ncbi:MAG: acetylxylan esterase [Clostridia bacterium]|nr:acetylxylan esterase [Clostridia bacterium]